MLFERIGYRARLVSVLAASLGIGTMLAACGTETAQQGSSDLTAAYRMRTLSTVLPGSARVPAVIAAAEETVRARGYSVESSAATEDAGRLVVRPPRTSDFPKMTIEASAVGHGTRVTFTVSPFGDEEMSRSVLDGVLQRLGL